MRYESILLRRVKGLTRMRGSRMVQRDGKVILEEDDGRSGAGLGVDSQFASDAPISEALYGRLLVANSKTMSSGGLILFGLLLGILAGVGLHTGWFSANLGINFEPLARWWINFPSIFTGFLFGAFVDEVKGRITLRRILPELRAAFEQENMDPYTGLLRIREDKQRHEELKDLVEKLLRDL